MSPVFTQESIPNTRSLLSAFVPLHSAQGSTDSSRIIRTSFTAVGLALSLGVTGSLVSSADAADSLQLAALPSPANVPSTLPSFGSDRPGGASATYHTVEDGETIWDIAKHHGVAVEDIKAANGIGEAQVIQAGQVLKVPAPVSGNAVLSQASVVPDEPKIAAVSSVPVVEPVEPEVDKGNFHSTSSADLSEFLELQQTEADASLQNEAAPSLQLEATSRPSNDDVPVASSVDVEDESAVALLPNAAPSEDFSLQLEAYRNPAPYRELEPVPSSPVSVTALPIEPEPTPIAPVELEPETAVDEQFVHRIGSGETIWSIARSYGVKPEAIEQSNGITDPSFILPGESLMIPVGSEAAAGIQSSEIERLAHRQLKPKSQSASIPSSSRDLGAISPSDFSLESTSDAAAVDGDITTESDAVTTERDRAAGSTAADPFVARLLSDVAETTQDTESASVEDEPQAATASEVFEADGLDASDATDAVAYVPESTNAETDAINPEFPAAPEPSLPDDGDSALAPDALLAAAPLGSEVYAPVVESPESRMVSPDMPLLPEQDEYLPEAPNRFNGYVWPAQGVLTSGYGWRWGRMHRGVDIAGPVGTPIHAAGPGVVVRSGWNSGGYGNLVEVRHPDGSMTRYAHNSRLLVSAGQQVRQGQQIAEMGSTGYSTGPHLHFEVHLPNQGTVNPIALLPGR